jgi:hypothetical protein
VKEAWFACYTKIAETMIAAIRKEPN